MTLYLGVDVGTSGVRAACLDESGALIADAAAALPRPRIEGDRAEADPETWWLGLRESLGGLATRVPLDRIEAVCIDGTSATILPVDAAGAALGPALLYRDTRARAEAERIALAAPLDSGAHGPTSALAKWLWLTGGRHPTDAWPADPSAYLHGRLAGERVAWDENNALKLGYDAVKRDWPDWLERLDLDRERLPPVVPAGTRIATVGPAAAAATGLRAGTAVVSGTTDSTAACIAAGVSETGDAMTSLGSTLVLKVLGASPVFAPRYGVYSHRLGDQWLIGGASNSGGAALERYFSRPTIEELSRRIDPASPTGLDHYPLPGRGERFPVCDPDLESRTSPRPANDATFLAALLEGIAAIEARGYRLLEELGAPHPRCVLSSGGGARNAAWSAIRARVLGIPLAPARSDSPAHGAALLALRSGGQPARPTP